MELESRSGCSQSWVYHSPRALHDRAMMLKPSSGLAKKSILLGLVHKVGPMHGWAPSSLAGKGEQEGHSPHGGSAPAEL